MIVALTELVLMIVAVGEVLVHFGVNAEADVDQLHWDGRVYSILSYLLAFLKLL